MTSLPLSSLCEAVIVLAIAGAADAQEYGKPDRDNPGDVMIQEYLSGQTERIHESFQKDLQSPEEWQARLPEYREQYFYMLGLWPLPEKTPLEATVTGTLDGEGFTVEMLHYQSRPGLYVTANLYRPSAIPDGKRLPAVLYVCGHAGRGRNGNKTAFQSHGMWFARHGYVCLIVDTLQLGEIAALHHGTYREGRWWWHSRGYTPAGVECWNGVRGIDYLVARPDVDPERIAVTGISGGGAATWWVAAADERARVAVPVSGMADLTSYVSHRVINGHCDCMFLYNSFQWPWTRIAALIAPRPLLFVNSDADSIFPMDANQRVINRLERIYSLYGAGDRVDALVSIGGHAYRQDIRQAEYRFINSYLKDDPRPITDSEVDLVIRDGNDAQHPIPPERLRVFPEDSDIPADELNTTIDEHFVPLANVELPVEGEFESWKRALMDELRRVVFRTFPDRIPRPEQLEIREGDEIHKMLFETEPGISVPLRMRSTAKPDAINRIFLVVKSKESQREEPDWFNKIRRPEDLVYWIEPRGVGDTRWTRNNPPNYVERSHVLLGQTADTGRLRDVIAVARYMRAAGGDLPIITVGEGNAALLAAYAALWEPDIAGAIIKDPPLTHRDADAPQFLNILRVCDVPEMLGLLAPMPLTVVGGEDSGLERVTRIYEAAGAAKKLSWVPN